MTATLPGGMEYKNLMTAAQEVADGEWGSQFPEEEGVRNLIVAVTGVRDEVGDIIVPGAFEHTLQRIEPKGCMGHDWNRVTGYPEAIEEVMPGDPRLPKTDRHGKPWPAEAGALFVRHRYHTDTEDGQRAYKDARFLGPRLACSIGYVDPKDENGRPLYSYKEIDSKSGLMTRFLPRLDLFEYSQVLHGAHLLAGGIKDGKPKRMERKMHQRPDMEIKVRLVRDSAYWGLPLGTPIRPGMKPQGPKARRIAATGGRTDENAGAVEINAAQLTIKPTAKGKQKGDAAVNVAFNGILDVIDGYVRDPRLELDPFEGDLTVEDDPKNKINKGDDYDARDILVANAVTPAQLQEWLDLADFAVHSVADADEDNARAREVIPDVVDAYREKYNAELVRQNDTGDSEVPDPDAAPATDSRTVNEIAEDDKYQRATERFNAAQAATPGQEEARQRAENNRAAAQRGELPLRRGENAPAAQPAPAEPSGPTRISAEDQAEITRLKQEGRDNEAAKLYREAVQRAREAEGITSEQLNPTRARLARQQREDTGAPSLEDGRTMQSVEAQRGEKQAFELAGDNGATLRVYELMRPQEPGKPWAYDIIGADGTVQEGQGTYRSPGSALVRAEGEFHEAEGQGSDNATPTSEPDADTPEGVPAGQAPEAPETETPSVPAAQTDGVPTGGALALRESGWDTPRGVRLAVHNGDPVSIHSNDGTNATVYNTRTEQRYEVPTSELLTGGPTLDNPTTIKLTDAQLAAASYAFDNGEPIEVSGAEMTRDGLVIADVGEALNTLDTKAEIFEDEPDLKRKHKRVLDSIRRKIGKLAKPGEPLPSTAGDDSGDNALPDNTSGDLPPSTVEPGGDLPPVAGEPGDAPEAPSGNSVRGLTDPSFDGVSTESLIAERGRVRGVDRERYAALNNEISERREIDWQLKKTRDKFNAVNQAKTQRQIEAALNQFTPDELRRYIEESEARSDWADNAAIRQRVGLARRALNESGAVDEFGQPVEPEPVEPEPTDVITPEEIADTDEAIDASFGVTEAPDGEFEADADIADRQDRVATLLAHSEAGSLDLSPERVSDDQLRTTRADVVDELRLQQHLERRRAGERAVSRQRAAQEAAEQADTTADGDTAEPEEDTGPKPRPGVAGAAEDLADALDDGDQARIEAATARLRSSVNRSRSDSEVVAEIRAMLDGPLDAETLRDAAARLRDEQRAKRNESAKRRRTARRFERERLRALLGQVETEMRNRNLDFDPIPDDDGTVTLDTPAPVVGWTVENRAPDWANISTRVETLEGAGYRATITTGFEANGKPLSHSDYKWEVLTDSGENTLSSGKGSVADADSARTVVEIALATQQRLGLIPVDSQVPQGSVPESTSATPLADVVDALDDMRARIIDGRKLNPVTGQPDPFGQGLPPLPEPAASRFAGADAGEVREYLEDNGPRRDGRPVSDHYRWDTAQLTPGGWFAVVDDMSGKPQIVHTLTGGTFNPDMSVGALGRADLMRYAEIAETLPDSDGRTADWGLKGDELRDSFNNRDFGATTEWGGAFRDFQASIVHRLTREKIAAGQFTHKLVQRDLAFSSGATNPSRKFYVSEMHRSLTPLVSAGKRQPNAFDKKTLDAAVSARTLVAMGAPDAAAVLLNRRAAEVRDEYGPDAPDHGSLVLDSLARGYLGMFSPMRSPGERVQSIKPGEQLFLSVGEGEPPRVFRALSAPRRDGHSMDMIVPVIDERGGDQKFLRISTTEIRIEDTEQPRYGFNPLSAALGGEWGAFIVVGPGEESPQTDEDVKARMFADADAVPQDVLDAAAEALPQPRRSAPRPAAQSRRAPAAPRARRTAPEPSAPEPVPGQQHLAQAQARADARFLGMPFSIGGAPERGAFGSVAEVREHLAAAITDQNWRDNYRETGSKDAVVREIDDGDMKLSPGGVFLVHKNGNVTHASSSLKVWPPAPGSGHKPMFDDLYGGGFRYSQTASMRVARALESGVFDGEQLDWSGNGMAAVKQSQVIAKRNGGFHPMQTAQRAAYRDGVLGAAKPTRTDVAMFGGMAGQLGLEGPNPEALDSLAVLNHRLAYEGREGYEAVTKKSADIGKQVGVEMELAESLAKTAPLDAVRRLTALADRLEGEKVELRIARDTEEFRRLHSLPADKTKTLTPSEDLRAVAKMITDMHDPDKISESGRFRKADMVGQVELSKPKITMGRSWEDPNGMAARRLESDIRESGGIRFYRDADGNLHATFNNSAGVPVDIADGMVQVGGGMTGAIKVTDNGRITLSYLSANRLIVIDLPPGSWKFTPEGGDNDEDTSGPETASPQAEAGDGVDVTGDIEEIRRLASGEPIDGDGEPSAGAGPESLDTPEAVEAKVREVYAELATEPQDWIRLARIRARLAGADRELVDEALRRMMRGGTVHLTPESNTKVLTDADRAAALREGSEDLHLIAIE